jgi:CBS domain containing-hemolysin-like protein
MTPETLAWVGIAACLSQSAMFSGLNLAMFGISRLNLEAAAEAGLDDADAILELRKDANFLLTTILWGNVSVNCLLTLLSDSVLAGVSAFVFSTVGITLVGEIVPQAYFSRNALRIGARLAPFLRFYQLLLYPVAKPSALMLDWWLGGEGVTYYRESDLREVIKMHMHADESDLSRVEGMGALNFISLDDLRIADEGEPVDEASIIALPAGVELPLLPVFERVPTDAFIRQVNASGHKWVILTDRERPAGCRS